MGLLTEPNHLLLGATQPLYQIDRSLRFNDDDSAYLTRTPGAAGDRRLWTWSGWVKRSTLDGGANYQMILGAGSSTSMASRFYFGWYADQFVAGYGPSDYRRSTAVFRDPSAWYHVVFVWDSANATADDRIKVWINGTQITAWGTNNALTQNTDGPVNNTVGQSIGRDNAGGSYFDGYMAEIHFVDGTALDPTSFGETNSNGVWVPINVTGLTYGTNGFYLPFSDNTSTTTLGYDESGNNNDWTLNNFSVAAGAGNDSLEDTPTVNWGTLNPIDSQCTLSNGNLDFVSSTTTWRQARASQAIPSAVPIYFEYTKTGASEAMIGAATASASLTANFGSAQQSWTYYNSSGNKFGDSSFGSGAAYGDSFAAGDVIGVAIDATAGKIWFAKNGTWQASGDPAAGTNPAFSSLAGYTLFPYVAGLNASTGGSLNFGQRPFAYTPPTGFSALCTANLPTPDIANPGSYMNAVTYTGTGSSLGVTGVGFQPDLVWIKGRSGATDHALYDSVRGVERQLESNTTTDETLESTGLTAFGSNGFTVGSLAQVNTSAATYVAWNWKKGITPGFDVVSYTGTGSATTIQHSLGAVPKLIIVKARSTASTDQGWPVYHASNTTAPETDYLLLNSNAATADLNTVWNDTAPTTTVFSVGTNALVNALNDTYVAYLFAEVEGFSKFGSYTGNGSTDGPFIWCGFRPRYVLIKSDSGPRNWAVFDAARNLTNVMNLELLSNQSLADYSTNIAVDFLSNGFKLRANESDSNTSAVTYLFAAFASQPFSAPSNAR